MEGKKLDIGQIYGYVVCLVAVLTFIFGAEHMVGAVLDIRELPYTQYYMNGPSLASLGAYKVDLLSRIRTEEEGGALVSLFPSDSTLQGMLEAERLQRLALSHQLSRRAIVINLFLLLLAGVLFAAHWIWLGTRERADLAQGS